MTVNNLAIILAPSVMPVKETIQHRLTSHVKVVEFLIENSNQIGVVPERLLSSVAGIVPSVSLPQINSITMTEEKKKKKRRSGSLTRMFNGLVNHAVSGFGKIVGKGSSESLDKSREYSDEFPATPCLTKSSKKRKVTDNINTFSAKKK